MPNQRNKLRPFRDFADLQASADEETIVKWVNDLFDKREANTAYHKKHYAKTRLLVQVAKEQLDRDELLAIERLAEQRLQQILNTPPKETPGIDEEEPSD